RLQNGKLLFGGVNGFNVFQPDNLYMNPFPPEIAFTSFQILNRPINAGDQFNGRVILEKSISQTEQIHLNYDENSFSVEFAALHFSAPTKNQYAFRLEGFQEEWAYVDAGKRFATFTNLGPGEYTLQVKASNNDGLWNNQIKNLVIRISPPFWQTWWAFLIYFFTFVGLLWAFRRYTVIGIREKHDLVLERLDKEKTEEIQQLKLQFFTNISHEIRTPLTLITGPLEYLLTSGRGLAYEDREKQYLLIRKNADFLLRLVNQLLDFRKIDQKQFSLKVFESDIVSYVKEITEPFQFIANKKNLTYTFHADVPHLTAWFDPDIIDKTLNNLLSNAFKFTPEGGKVEVHISALTPAETKGTSISGLHGLELRILDSGPGIPEEDREHVFDRFFKSKQDSGENSLGAGIGLSYTRDLIHLHQGIIKVEPATLGGACFVVQIPVEGAAYNQENIGAPSELRTREQIPIWDQYKDETEAEKTQEESTNNEETAPQVSILVVDDNKDIRSFVRNALQQSYQIYEAEDGIEGLEMAKEHSPDLIISDIMMPRMNGIELCQELKSNPLTSHIAVIMLTARASDESEKESLEFGADAYIRKPFKLDLLQLKVKNLLRLRNQIHQQFRKEVILQPEAVSATSTDEIFLKKAMDLIEEHMTDPDFNVENMAVEIGMSRSKLYLKLKALTGQSSSEFIRRVRLKRAVQLLESSDLTVKEIMYMTGFNTASYFSKCFKKVYGIVPSEYVSKRKQNHPTHTASE
ncbi:MAG: response regulator, partial [Bacteroidota bacterium]